MDWTPQFAKELREIDHALRQQVLSGELGQLTVLKLQAERKYREKANKLLARYSKLHDILDYLTTRRVDFFLLFIFLAMFGFLGGGVWSYLGYGWLWPLWLFWIVLNFAGIIFLGLANFIQPAIELMMPGMLKNMFEIPEKWPDDLPHDKKLELLARVEVLGAMIGMDYERMKVEVRRDMEEKMETTPEKVLEEMGKWA